MPPFTSRPLNSTSSPILTQMRKHPFVLFGLPFVGIIVASSYALSEFTQTRYDYQQSKVRALGAEEELGMRGDRRKVDLKEEYYRLNAPLSPADSALDASFSSSKSPSSSNQSPSSSPSPSQSSLSLSPSSYSSSDHETYSAYYSNSPTSLSSSSSSIPSPSPSLGGSDQAQISGRVEGKSKRKGKFSMMPVSQDEYEPVRVPRPEGVPEWGAPKAEEMPVKGQRKEDQWV